MVIFHSYVSLLEGTSTAPSNLNLYCLLWQTFKSKRFENDLKVRATKHHLIGAVGLTALPVPRMPMLQTLEKSSVTVSVTPNSCLCATLCREVILSAPECLLELFFSWQAKIALFIIVYTQFLDKPWTSRHAINYLLDTCSREQRCFEAFFEPRLPQEAEGVPKMTARWPSLIWSGVERMIFFLYLGIFRWNDIPLY